MNSPSPYKETHATGSRKSGTFAVIIVTLVMNFAIVLYLYISSSKMNTLFWQSITNIIFGDIASYRVHYSSTFGRASANMRHYNHQA